MLFSERDSRRHHRSERTRWLSAGRQELQDFQDRQQRGLASPRRSASGIGLSWTLLNLWALVGCHRSARSGSSQRSCSNQRPSPSASSQVRTRPVACLPAQGPSASQCGLPAIRFDRMAKSIVLAADPSRLASLLLSCIPAVCAFVAPSHPGVSVAIIDRLSHSRALTTRKGSPLIID